jgi:hypothetical protein
VRFAVTVAPASDPGGPGGPGDPIDPTPPGAGDACKNDGWRDLLDAEGRTFRNQGACVSYFASGGRGGPNRG